MMLDAVDAYKQVIIQKGEVPGLNMFGRAIINPNGRVPKHTHANMDEVRGRGMIYNASSATDLQMSC